MRQPCDKIDESTAAPTTESVAATFSASGKIVADAFVVHGHRNPEGGIRRWREAEYAEVATKTLFPAGVPDNMSNSVLKEVVNRWLRENTNWQVLKHGVLKRDEVSGRTVGRVRKLPRG